MYWEWELSKFRETNNAASGARYDIHLITISDVGIEEVNAESHNYIDDNGYVRGTGIAIGGVIWAPVNLGYSNDYPYGKLYQWGRLDGQGYGDANSKDEAGTTVTVSSRSTADANIMSEPSSNTFYSINAKLYDWHANRDSNQYNSEWNSIPKDDYVGNPCPSGWRLPTGEELGALSANRSDWTTKDGLNGYYFKGSDSSLSDANSVFLPAAGYRSGTDGNSAGRKTDGAYWATNNVKPNGSCLQFNSGSATTGNAHRSNGYSIRCVME